MRRRPGTPDGETMSYCPPPPDVIRLNMSFELPAYFADTLQPVAFSNGATHCFSVYPSQAMSVSLPSPAPTDVGSALPLDTPAAGTARTVTRAANATYTKRI